MAIDDNIGDEKLQYDINGAAAKISSLWSGNIDRYEYITGEQILPFNQSRMIEQANFSYSSLAKAFEKQTKKTKKTNKQKNHVDRLKSLHLSNQIVELK